MAGQTIALREPPAKTQVEDFLRVKGHVLVKVFHDVGVMNASYGASIEVSTLRLFDPSNIENPSDGLRVDVKKDDSDNTESAFLDLDEVDSLVSGLQYMAQLAGQAQGYSGDYTEVVFSTKGDLGVGFYIKERKVQAFVKLGFATVFVAPQLLRQLSELLVAGQTYLRSTPIAFGQKSAGA